MEDAYGKFARAGDFLCPFCAYYSTASIEGLSATQRTDIQTIAENFNIGFSAVVTTTIRLRFDGRATPTRLQFDCATTIRRHSALTCQRQMMPYVTVTLMTLVERPSNGRRTEVESSLCVTMCVCRVLIKITYLLTYLIIVVTAQLQSKKRWSTISPLGGRGRCNPVAEERGDWL